jgi:hypothetical protein
MKEKDKGKYLNNEINVIGKFKPFERFLPADWPTGKWGKRRMAYYGDISTGESYQIWQRPEHNTISHIDYDPRMNNLSATAIAVYEVWEENAGLFQEFFRDPKNIKKIPVGLWRVMKQASLTLGPSGDPAGISINYEIGVVSRNKATDSKVRPNPYFGMKIAAWHKDRYDIRNTFKKQNWTVTVIEPVAVPAWYDEASYHRTVHFAPDGIEIRLQSDIRPDTFSKKPLFSVKFAGGGKLLPVGDKSQTVPANYFLNVFCPEMALDSRISNRWDQAAARAKEIIRDPVIDTDWLEGVIEAAQSASAF